MGDDLGDEWWTHEGNSDASELEEETKQPAEKKKTPPVKRKNEAEKTSKAKKKKTDVQVVNKKSSKLKSQEEHAVPPKKETGDNKSSQPKKKRKKKKKTITDVLASSEQKPGCWSDLQALVTQHFSDKRSVIELEELELHNSCFLQSNDLTHTLSSYLKQVCPKWAKIQKQHTEKSSVVLLVVCSSALRTIELIKQLTTFKGEAKAIKLFAKHIKIEEQVKLLQKGITHVGVGTPGRISALIEKEGLNLQALRYVVLDWNWRDVKLRRMADIPEIKLDLMKLLESGVLAGCKEDRIKLGLF